MYNQCILPIKLRVQINLTHTTLCNKVCQLLATDRYLSPGTPFSSTNKIDSHDINDRMLKVAINTKTLTLTPSQCLSSNFFEKFEILKFVEIFDL